MEMKVSPIRFVNPGLGKDGHDPAEVDMLHDMVANLMNNQGIITMFSRFSENLTKF